MSGPEARHAVKVMRHKPGDNIEIFDGKGRKYLAVIVRASGGVMEGKLVSGMDDLEPETQIELCFSLVSRQTVESILQHAVEIGVARFQPMITERTQYDLRGKWPEKLNRWRQVIVSACKQCGRAFIPEISAPAHFEDAVKSADIPSLVAFELEKKVSIHDAMDKILSRGEKRVRLFIGPEGGFTDKEIEAAVRCGAVTFSLGKIILRADTACIAACAVILNSRDRPRSQ